jgi:toxin ParE1/3/4
MAQVIWTKPAVADLDAIADYISIDNPPAARALVARVFGSVEQLADQPETGSRPRELGPRSRYRQLGEPPCRIFYRYEVATERVFILYVMRGERLLRGRRLAGRDRGTPRV